MAEKTAVVNKKKKTAKKPEVEAPWCENPSPAMEYFNGSVVKCDAFGDKIYLEWGESIHEQINYLDEDLFIQILNADDGSLYKEVRVNHLVGKEIDVKAASDYKVRLVVREKFRVAIATTSEYTPRITFIPESIDRYLLTWGELEWDHISREVSREHHVNWENDVDVVLKIFRWEADEQSPLEEWRFPGLKAMEIVGGKIKDLYLVVVRKDNKEQLKEIFKVNVVPGQEKRVMDELDVKTPLLKPYLWLTRKVRETDTTNISVRWDIPEFIWEEVGKDLKKKKKDVADYELSLKLYSIGPEGPIEYRPEEKRAILSKGNWFFGNVFHGTTYFAQLVLIHKEKGDVYNKPLIQSNEFYVPFKNDEVVLLPIDEKRIFAYWHLNRSEVWKNLVENHDAKPDNVHYFIRVFHEFAGSSYHHQHLDVEFHLDFTDNMYLGVEEDKLYRVQLIAVVDGWKVVELTSLSNVVQTGRLVRGNNPVSYVSFHYPEDHPTHRRIESKLDTAGYSLGKIIMHLHAHLPFIGKRVNYGTSGFWRPGGYIEEWYHEAVRDTYIPLIAIFDELVDEGIDFKMSMDISPTLTNMMRNPVLQEEFLNNTDSLIALAKTEVERTKREEPWFTTAARMHLREFRKAKSIFLRYDRDLTKAFRKFQDLGKLEISTCGATHGFLPLMGSKNIEAIRGQIKTAVLDYEDTFGRKPYGIWLPECAYTTGIEKVLEEFGIRYFFTETHTLLRGDSRVEFGVNAPAYIKGSPVAILARDPETGKQVWSGDEGYPGDPDYLEFHLRGGPLKYNRITDRRGTYKQPYVPEWAEAKAAMHANNFMENRNFRFQHIHNWFWKKPLVVATYDAELFGHHWYEGPRFLYYLLKKLHYDQNQTELTTPSDYLADNTYNQEIYPTPSSWGDKGTFDKWMYGAVSWMYRHMNDACDEMINLATWGRENGLHEKPADSIGVRILSQMARQLLLAQNSDHGFNISNGHFVDRIKELFFEDLDNFWILSNMFVKYMKEGTCNEVLLRKLEHNLMIFPVIDPFVWARR